MDAVKKGTKLRVCIKPKELNQAIKRPHYPMPVLDDIRPKLANAKIFTVLDLKEGLLARQAVCKKQLPNDLF